jgi:hypothetical protein
MIKEFYPHIIIVVVRGLSPDIKYQAVIPRWVGIKMPAVILGLYACSVPIVGRFYPPRYVTAMDRLAATGESYLCPVPAPSVVIGSVIGFKILVDIVSAADTLGKENQNEQ